MPLSKMPRYKEFLQHLRGLLPEAKVSHSIFVAEYFSTFADLLEVDHDAAVTAGLLHDSFRVAAPEELLDKAREYGLPVEEEQRAHPILLHGPVAAEYGQRVLGVSDPAVYEAIYWHTTGKSQLGKLGQGLYVADFSEPLRSYDEAAEVREWVRKGSFGKAILRAAEAKAGFASQEGGASVEATAFLEWLRMEYA